MQPTRRTRPDYTADVGATRATVGPGITFSTIPLVSPRAPADLELTLGPAGTVVLNAPMGFVQEHSAEYSGEARQAVLPHLARSLRAGRSVYQDVEETAS